MNKGLAIGLTSILLIGGGVASYYFIWGRPSDKKVNEVIAKSKKMGHDIFLSDKAFAGIKTFRLPHFNELYRAYMAEDEEAIGAWRNKQFRKAMVPID